MRTLIRLFMVATFFFSSAQGFAQSEYLITLVDGKPTAQLAKSWRKLDDQKFEFTLDTSKEVGRGRPVSSEFVKSSVESSRMPQRMGVTTEVKSDSVIVIAYKGEEQEFWKQLAGVRIRARQAVNLALESSVSGGGLRANKISRAAGHGEVKASFVSLERGIMTVFAYQLGSEGVPPGIRSSQQLRLRVPNDPELSKLKPDDDLFFKPVRLKGGVWQVRGIELK